MQRQTVEELLNEAKDECGRRGILELRPLQREVLSLLAEGRSVFAGLPTGYGKSLCYWLPAAAWSWKVWVISPLVSLIEDQALACRALGLRVVSWHGSLNAVRRRELEAQMEAGSWQVCFLSPERFVSWAENGYLKILQMQRLDADLIVLDEMHCLEEWRSFRSGYRNLFEHIRRTTGSGSLLLGLSASLAERDSNAWMNELCGSHRHVGAGLGRPNLHLQVHSLEAEEERWMLLLSALRDLYLPESALVYCSSRHESDEAARWLRSAGIDAVAYHAGLPGLERSSRSVAFREGRLRVVCATSAFGMGIDYPHVSRVIHFSMPHDLESYWQEVGRAGRSGQRAYGIALWRRSELYRARTLRSSELERFVALWRAWASGNCRKRVIAEKLGMPQPDCGNCDRCLKDDTRTATITVMESQHRQAWWLEAEANPEEWLEEKLQSFTQP